LVYDETLINSIKLADLQGTEPIMKMGQVRWYKKIDPRCTYVVAHDPSLGTGGDPAAIEIFEIPSMIQVGEWHHNLTPIQPQVRILRDICRYIDNECLNAGQQSSIYYSVENNTLGEAAIIAINEMGEESIPGMFVSEPVRRGHVRKFRRGFNTTNNSKIAACAKLKQMIENNLITINSKSLISELKSFIAKGTSFEAKETQHDDLVAALLLAIRMIVMLGDWDPVVYSKMTENRQLEESDLPMPIYISNSI